MTSFVHTHLESTRQLGDFDDNRPRRVRCVHPLVTLLEKLDAITRRMARSQPPATFVRHFEDAAHIIEHHDTLPPVEGHDSVASLAREMLGQKQIAALPTASHEALTPDDGARWNLVHQAHEAIGPMFWGPRMSIEDACAVVRSWIDREFP